MEMKSPPKPMDDPSSILLALLMGHDFDEECRPPWGCEKVEEFWGPGTGCVWQVYSEGGGTIGYLKSSVDGPAIVAKVNDMDWEGLLA